MLIGFPIYQIMVKNRIREFHAPLDTLSCSSSFKVETLPSLKPFLFTILGSENPIQTTRPSLLGHVMRGNKEEAQKNKNPCKIPMETCLAIPSQNLLGEWDQTPGTTQFKPLGPPSWAIWWGGTKRRPKKTRVHCTSKRAKLWETMSILSSVNSLCMPQLLICLTVFDMGHHEWPLPGCCLNMMGFRPWTPGWLCLWIPHRCIIWLTGRLCLTFVTFWFCFWISLSWFVYWLCVMLPVLFSYC